MINISKLDKAAVLAALYNASRPQGMGFLQYEAAPMTVEQARGLLLQTTDFDYLKGRVMKVNIEDELDPYLYDRDNGEGAAEAAIKALIECDRVNAPDIAEAHAFGKAKAAKEAMSNLEQPVTSTVEGGMHVVTIGLSDVAEPLKKAIEMASPQRAREARHSTEKSRLQ